MRTSAKKSLCLALVMVISAFSFVVSAGSANRTAHQSVAFTIGKGDTQDLKDLLNFSYDDNGAFEWETEDHIKATVNSSGILTARQTGTVTVTCKHTDSSGSVHAQKFKARVISRSSNMKTYITKSLVMESGDTKNLKDLLNYAHDKSGTFQWSSEKDSIATVDSNGKVTAHRAGTVTITARYNARHTDLDAVDHIQTFTLVIS